MNELKGRTAVVTGGSRGLGRGVVEAVARDPQNLAKLKAEVRGDVQTYAADATDPVVAAQILERERPTLLVLNAGANGITRPTKAHTWETFSRHIDVDLRSVFNWTREALVLPLEKGSTIVIVSSAGALRASTISAGYAAAKAAIWSFARAVAGEAQEMGLRVHCLLPGLAPETELGGAALKAFSRSMGVSEDEVLERKGMRPVFTAALMGTQLLELLTDPAKADTVSYRATGRGLVALPEVG
jgi:NAD(P)-dependent dehydrogenase (short-subunit alcohol dehydrogenase family)